MTTGAIVPSCRSSEDTADTWRQSALTVSPGSTIRSGESAAVRESSLPPKVFPCRSARLTIVSGSGRYYYDRGTGRCVEADGIVAGYLEGTGSETDKPKDSSPATGTNAPEESSGTGNGTQS